MKGKAGILVATALVMMSLALAASCSRGGQAAPVAPVVPVASTAGMAGTVAVPASLAPGKAILVQGTRPVKGLPGLGNNVLPGLAGEYAYLPADSSAVLGIKVWFSTVAVVAPPAWTALSCPTLPKDMTVFASPPGADAIADDSLLWLISADGYRLMLSMPATLASPCRFAAMFAERFSFFHRYAERPGDVSFPAILEPGS